MTRCGIVTTPGSPTARTVDQDVRQLTNSAMWTVVRSAGAALVVGNAGLAVALLDDGLVFSAQWWARWVYPLLSLVAAAMVLLRAGVVPRSASGVEHRGDRAAVLGDRRRPLLPDPVRRAGRLDSVVVRRPVARLLSRVLRGNGSAGPGRHPAFPRQHVARRHRRRPGLRGAERPGSRRAAHGQPGPVRPADLLPPRGPDVHRTRGRHLGGSRVGAERVLGTSRVCRRDQRRRRYRQPLHDRDRHLPGGFPGQQPVVRCGAVRGDRRVARRPRPRAHPARRRAPPRRAGGGGAHVADRAARRPRHPGSSPDPDPGRRRRRCRRRPHGAHLQGGRAAGRRPPGRAHRRTDRPGEPAGVPPAPRGRAWIPPTTRPGPPSS